MTQKFVINSEILSTVKYIRKYVTRIQLRRFISGNVLLWPSVRTRFKANGNLYLMVCFAETMDLARSSKCIRRDFCSEVGPQRVLHSFWLYFWQAAADNGRNWFQPCRLSTLHSSRSSNTKKYRFFRVTSIFDYIQHVQYKIEVTFILKLWQIIWEELIATMSTLHTPQ